MKRYRFALQTVVAKEAKAYGFAVVLWCTGSLLLVDRGKPTARGVIVFAGGVLAAQACGVLLAFGNPTKTWHLSEAREYVWSTFHIVPVAAGVLLAWLLAARLTGMWAYGIAPFVALLAYQLLLGLESLLLTVDQVSSVTADDSASRSD